MTDYQTFLLRLNHNLQTLQEREAKQAGNASPDLLNQIEDHRQAITLTEQAIAGHLTEAQWLEELQPLLVAQPGLDLLAVWLVSKYAFDQGVALGRELGPQALAPAQEIFTLSMDRLRQTPKGELIAAEFEQDPATYEKPVEKELNELIQADEAFAKQLEALLAQLHHALAAHNAGGPTYQAKLSGSGQIVQGKGATGIQQGDRGQLIIGGSIGGDLIGPGGTKQDDEPHKRGER